MSIRDSNRAIALLSSGLDSTVAVGIALEQGWQIDLSVTFDYGQRAARQELEHSRKIAEHFDFPHKEIQLPWFMDFNQRGLLSETETLPSPNAEQLEQAKFCEQSAQFVWVPNRNGTLIEITAGIAEDRGASAVIVGFNREEAATFPDNTTDYLDSLNEALAFSTANGVRVISPTIQLNKKQIVKRAIQWALPWKLLWSCYQGDEKMCGCCESCQRLKRALNANGVVFNELFHHALMD